MWFIGLIIGAFIGGTLEDIEGAVVGAAVGLLVGYVIGRMLDQKALLDRLQRLEARLDSFEQRLGDTELRRARIANEVLRADERAVEEPDAIAEPAGATPAPTADVPLPRVAPPTEPAYADLPDFDAMPASTSPRAYESARVDPTVSARPPAPPTGIAALPSMAWAWLTGGNTIVRVGVIVLFFGVAFLLKYAYDHTHIPPAVRVSVIALGGIALLVLGWRLRKKREGYALALQGAGIGVLYLTVFASLRLFALIEPGFAFALLIAICAASAWIALLQNAQSLAVLGFAGGFIAPILVSTGSGNYVALFSYYVVLNLGVLAISWKKAWRPLNLLAFVFTFAVSAMWGTRSFHPELWSTSQPFLAAFFLIYVLIPAFFARAAVAKTERYLDATLIFGLPIIAFGMQYALSRHFEFGPALSALAVSAIYFIAARMVRARHGQDLTLVTSSFAALAVGFATLTVPLAVDSGWTAAAWAIEGAALVWVGLRQGSVLQRAFGYALQLGAGAFFFHRIGFDFGAELIPVLNRSAFGFALLALAAFFTGWMTSRHHDKLKPVELVVPLVALAIGLLWWTSGGIVEIDRHVPRGYRYAVFLMFATVSCVAFEFLGRWALWTALRRAGLAIAPVAALVFVLLLMDHGFGSAFGHYFGLKMFWVWVIALGTHLWMLRRHDDELPRLIDALHTLGLWLLAAVAARELHFALTQMNAETSAWPIAIAILPATLLLGFISARGQRVTWPIAARWNAYLVWGCGGLAAGLAIWLIWITFTSTGEATPLPYVTLLNPLDLMVLSVLLAIVLWWRSFERMDAGALVSRNTTLRYGSPGVAAFIAANGILLRSIHHYADVPWTFYDLTSSMVVQSALSIFWTVLALTLMVLAHRWKRRVLWVVGAALLAVAVAKLFLIDLSNVGGIERIVSFVVVGILMLVVGYFAPVPPKAQQTTS